MPRKRKYATNAERQRAYRARRRARWIEDIHSRRSALLARHLDRHPDDFAMWGVIGNLAKLAKRRQEEEAHERWMRQHGEAPGPERERGPASRPSPLR